MLQQIKTAVLLPWYAISIFTGEKSFRRNPILGSVRLNRRGLHVWRVKLAARIVAWRRQYLEYMISDEDRNAYDANGYIEKRGLLPPDLFAALVTEIENLRVPAREMYEGNAVTRRTPLTPDVVKDNPAIKAFLESKEWTGLIRYIGGFDVEPVISVQTIFAEATPKGKGKDPQTNLHMDTFHSTVKAWFFLYDVPMDEGPFTYVRGSHKLTKRRLAWQKRKSVLSAQNHAGGAFRISPGELKYLHLPEPTAFAVPANTLVVGDTFGFHARGASSRASVRVEIYASQRPNPFLPVVGLDTAALPLVKGRKQVIPWVFEDLAVKLGLGKQKWFSVGRPKPGEPVANGKG